jgi:hypothetical protein
MDSAKEDLKVKFILFIDLATKFRATETLFTYKHGEYQTETADQVIRALMLRWLVDKPRPRYVVFDNANTMTSTKTVEILADVGIQPFFPPEGESWAHGITERGVGQIKETASLLQQSLPDQDPVLTLAMATCALNNTEFTKGFTSVQWAYGHQNQVGDDDLRQQLSLPIDRQQQEFGRLLTQRDLAEECARKSRAKVALSKLKNSSIRQPLRTFSMAQPVYIWRKFLPHTIYAGRKGGHRHTAKPRWVGPGRVVFHELTPGQHAEDRKHVVWVILGNRIYKTSVHSVRPLSEREMEFFEAKGDESHLWKQLSDMIPKREFIDITGEEPTEEEKEEIPLPEAPNVDTFLKPRVRFPGKFPISSGGIPVLPELPGGATLSMPSSSALPSSLSLPRPTEEPVNVYDNIPDPTKMTEDELEREFGGEVKKQKMSSHRRDSITSKTPLLDRPEVPQEETVLEDDLPVPEPETKKTKYEEDDDSDNGKDGLALDLSTAIQESGEGYVMNIDLNFESNRQKKLFMADPVIYLSKKVNSAEVNYRRLTEDEKQLFENAKNSEVSSFLKTQAVRRCLSFEESQKAQQSDRVLRARWVLTWKGVPEESREEAAMDRENNKKSTYTADLSRKAKARIVLLGFQHPDLESPDFRTTSPVQSQLMKHLSLVLCSQRKWKLESLDMKTAFLQTGAADMESKELWTPGVPELRAALGAQDHELLRILRNVYGNATAPRGLWNDVDATFVRLGGHRLVGDNSFWVWTEENEQPRNPADRFRVIGFVGGHVDDFNRGGDLENPKWLEVRRQIDEAYKWGTMKEDVFRHTGVDVSVNTKGEDHWIELNQDFYVETLQNVAIPEHRLRGDGSLTLTSDEVAACRASLGALQWVASQTQIQACSRVNLLLTELTVNKNITVAKEINDLVKELRSNPMVLRLYRLPQVQHWQDFVVVTMADQADANRPQGGSTGGLLTCLGGPEQLHGEAGRLNPIAWRTWKLKRKAISTNDGEMQATLEGEDHLFRTRWMWCQLNGCCAIEEPNILLKANDLVKYVPGILATDSKGAFDAINKNEGPLLGLSNVRSALQAYQLREQLSESMAKLIWISGDWNLGDAMTKKHRSSREGLLQFIKAQIWKLKYDPGFVLSEKKARKTGLQAVQQMRQLQALQPFPSHDSRKFLDWCDGTSLIES